MKPLFHALVTRDGIPVYLDQLPDIITPTAVSLFVMSGGADDAEVGAAGIHHWGEHLPFRGTVLYPKANEVFGRIRRLGGVLNASTSPFRTRYYATAPRAMWTEALNIIADLAARPLNRPEDIEAERQIIGEEIREYESSQSACFGRAMRETLWGTHRFAQSVLGTRESLASMDLDIIEQMHRVSYGKERCILFISGAIPPGEALAEAERALEVMPQRGISIRRTMAEHEQLPPWRCGEENVVDSTFVTSTAALVFPYPAQENRLQRDSASDLLVELLTKGGPTSPLQRVLREERNLTYGAHVSVFDGRIGGYIALFADTARDKTDAVIQALRDVIQLPELRGTERYEEVAAMRKAEYAMRLISPLSRVDGMGMTLLHTGRAVSFESAYEAACATPAEDAHRLLDMMNPENAHVFIYRGTK